MMTEFQRKQILDVMVVGYELNKAINSVMEDGKFSVLEVLDFFPVAKAVPEAIKDFNTIPDSIHDMSEEDKEFFSEKFKEQFNIPSDEVEQKIELAFAWALDTVMFAMSFIKK